MLRARGVEYVDMAKIEQGRRIAEARSHVGLSQEKLAGLVGVARSTLITWETGAVAPPSDKLSFIAELTGFSGNYLLLGDPPRDRNDGLTVADRIRRSSASAAEAVIEEIERTEARERRKAG